jgi:hypothetical protein
MEQFARVFSGPGFRVVVRQMRRLNDFLLRYRAGIEGVLETFGRGIAGLMDTSINRISTTFQGVLANLESIGARIDSIIATVRRIAPIARGMVIGGIALKLAAGALGTAFAVAGGLFSAIGPLMTVLTPLLGGGGLAGALGIGGAAAAGTAAAGGAAVVGTGGIAAIAAVGAAFVALQAIVFALVGAIPAVVGLFIAVYRNGQFFAAQLRTIGPMLWETVENFWAALVSLYEAVSPFLETLGLLIGGVLIVAIRGNAGLFLFLSRVIRVVAAGFSAMMSMLSPVFDRLRAAFMSLFGWLGAFATALRQLVSFIPGVQAAAGVIRGAAPAGGGRGPVESAFSRLIAGFRDAMNRGADAQSPTEGTGRAPGARPTTNVDMRGSRIEVRQEFREADPDRVWVSMRDALEREAIQRTTSGFAPALTR